MLETDCVWAKIFPMREDSTWKILTKPEFDKAYYDFDPHYPAPSMAEVLKELPNNTAFLKNKIYYASTGGKDNVYKEFISTNPTDALIDLLIWVRKETKDAD